MSAGDKSSNVNTDMLDAVTERKFIETEEARGTETSAFVSASEIDSDDIIIHMDSDLESDMILDWDSLYDTLRLQVNEELSAAEKEGIGTAKMKILKRAFFIAGVITAVLLLCAVFLIGTKPGRKIIYRIAGNMIHDSVDVDGNMDNYISNSAVNWNNPIDKESNDSMSHSSEGNSDENTPEQLQIVPRKEDYVSNFLIFGIEKIEGGRNTDAMMIVSINTKDNTIKLSSLLRDTLVEIPGYGSCKLNAVYAKGDASLLVNTIEQNYRIEIEGYASIDFDAFEAVINHLGGVSIELGKEEANYLNKTNYISNPAYRNVVPGWNVLNGNQALGYCRIRKVPTLGGSNDDYGRTLRQRRVLNAIFNQYKSKNLFELLSITKKCLGYVTTNVTQEQIEAVLEDVVENKITSMDTIRIPVNGMFDDPNEYKGVSSPLVLEWEANIKELHKFIFLDEEENAVANNSN